MAKPGGPYVPNLETPLTPGITPTLTAKELSRLISLHPVTILKWARQGEIPHRRLSARKIVFLVSEVNDWLASRYTDTAVRAAPPERKAA